MIQTPRALQFDVVLTENDYSPGSQNYVHRVRLDKKDGWQEVVLTPSDFTSDKNGHVLNDWRPFDSLDFGSKDSDRTDGVTFAKIRWVQP